MFRQVFCLLLLFILMTLVPSHVNNRRKRKHHLNSVFYDMFLTTNSNTLNEQLIVVLGLSADEESLLCELSILLSTVLL